MNKRHIIQFIREIFKKIYQFLFFAHVSPGFHLGNVHSVDLSEVTPLQIFNQGPLFMGHFLQGDRVWITWKTRTQLVANFTFFISNHVPECTAMLKQRSAELKLSGLDKVLSWTAQRLSVNYTCQLGRGIALGCHAFRGVSDGPAIRSVFRESALQLVSEVFGAEMSRQQQWIWSGGPAAVRQDKTRGVLQANISEIVGWCSTKLSGKGQASCGRRSSAINYNMETNQVEHQIAYDLHNLSKRTM